MLYHVGTLLSMDLAVLACEMHKPLQLSEHNCRVRWAQRSRTLFDSRWMGWRGEGERSTEAAQRRELDLRDEAKRSDELHPDWQLSLLDTEL